MKITKHDQCGLIIEEENCSIVIDPVSITHDFPTVNNVVAIFITHDHADHFQLDVINRLRHANPGTKIFGTAAVIGKIDDGQIVKSGDKLNIGEFNIKIFGKDHAPIVDDTIPCDNFGIVINEKFVYPGDSFDQPPIDNIPVLTAGVSAPWLKFNDAAEYLAAAKPDVFIPVHDALLSEMGLNVTKTWLNKVCDENDIKLIFLEPGESYELN